MQNLQIRLMLIVFVTAILLPAAPAAEAAAKPPATPTNGDLLVRLQGADRATAEVGQTWEGARAAAMRQTLDAMFGNADRVLSEEELARLSAATTADMKGKPAPFFTWDGQPALVEDATVAFHGGAGPISSTAPLTMRHDLALLLQPRDAIPHELVLSPLWNGTFRFEWGNDWAAEVNGSLDVPKMESGAFTTAVAQATPVRVVLSDAPVEATPAAGASALAPPAAGEAPQQSAGGDAPQESAADDAGQQPAEADAPAGVPEGSAADAGSRRVPLIGATSLVAFALAIALLTVARRRGGQ